MRKPIEFAELEWDEHGQPRSRQYNDIYFFSSDDPQQSGLAESRYVFLQHNQLAERWQALKNSDHFVIGETGFGTGLNFLATWQLWEQIDPPHAHLHYLSVEKHPLRPTDLARVLAAWPELHVYAEQLLAQYPRLLTQGFFSLAFPGSRLLLTLIIDDVETALSDCLQSQHPHFQIPFGPGVDAWYLDGFAPRLNPAMWSDTVLMRVAQLSHADTTFATFTAAGAVQRQLKALGFEVEKFPGFGNKREMLCGRLLAKKQTQKPLNPHGKYPLPWSVVPRQATGNKEVTIIGAGLAGCHSARVLAERGWRVRLLDAGDEIAGGASGNAQSIVYAKLSADDDALARFNLSALLVAANFYCTWWRDNEKLGHNCGVLQLASNDKELRMLRHCGDYFAAQCSSHDNGDARFVDPTGASAIAGIDIQHPGILFPRLGWLRPRLLCQALVDHPLIELQARTTIVELQPQGKAWQLYDADQQLVCDAETVVIANAYAATQFAQTHSLPLKKIRGQVSYLVGQQCIETVKTVVCGENFIAPITANGDRLQTIGATFNLHYDKLSPRTEDNQSNIDGLSSLIPSLQNQLSTIAPSLLDGRAHYRCTSPDYLPLVGPVHQHETFINDYPRLRVNANSTYHRAGRHWPGLFINVAHGSRGLAYTPLCARILAAYINGDPLPIGRDLAQALHPGRFTIRGLIRRKF